MFISMSSSEVGEGGVVLGRDGVLIYTQTHLSPSYWSRDLAGREEHRACFRS